MKTSSKSGSILVAVLAVLVVLSLSLGSVVAVALQQFNMVQHKIDSENAFYAAEAGLEAGALYFIENVDYLPSTYTATGSVANQTYTYTMNNTNYPASHSIVKCDLKSVGTVNGKTRAIALQGVRNGKFSDYAFLAENNFNIYFKSKEQFWGRVHTGTAPYFDGDPEFHGKMTTATNYFVGSTNQVTFHKGFSKNVIIEELADVNFQKMKTFATTYGLLLSGDTSIEFDGTNMLITNAEKGWNNQSKSLADAPVVYVQRTTRTENYQQGGRWYTRTVPVPGTLIIKGGTLDGNLTVVSEDNSYIEGHTQYTVDPLEKDENGKYTSDDTLGIISGKDVVIPSSAPNDLIINASIIATGAMGSTGSFYVDNLGDYKIRGFLNITGGLVQKNRGTVGYFSLNTGQTTSGFNKRYIFDSRLESTPPPCSPSITTALNYDSWREVKEEES